MTRWRGPTATLGLTGSIGMGKSTAAGMFRSLGVPVHDADAAVHAVFRPGGAAVGPVGEAFPEAVRDGAVDRAVLGRAVFGDSDRLARLEAIVHPLVRLSSERFLRLARARRVPLAVFDVPLLFETGAQARYDAVAVVSAPAFVQTQRVLARPGMTADRLAAIRERQTPDAEKRRRADFVLPTGLGRRSTLQGVRRIVRLMTEH
ncbi:MAG: dephospho-CoA kinase [Rhodospirillaceae bacterium]|jgi:dephospho-CoA kinase|nr:dephospho-CoA kinase [Rhodospirillaceae bacterium]MBT5412963.1 dephospho-CoA kinase [Rhodospirillaceae bacterium]MBT6118007.1 dephospho-CoA kinase [Rhodospirillaceae bacterium]